jgi:glucose dehydrogenase
MRPPRLVIAFLLAVVGFVWIGQGIGLIGGSAMTGSPFWAIVGVVLIGLAVAIIVRERRPSPRD